MTTELKIKTLTEQPYYAHAYYTLDRRVVEDAEYDRLYRELVALESENPNLVRADSPTHGEPATSSVRLSKVHPRLPALQSASLFSRSSKPSTPACEKKFLHLNISVNSKLTVYLCL